jgi:hypothetical protein
MTQIATSGFPFRRPKSGLRGESPIHPFAEGGLLVLIIKYSGLYASRADGVWQAMMPGRSSH